ncbi:thymidylate kinase [Novosphingobium sp. PhB165]|uniref:hypothetical protein n=1 Tax=Novosphingobium sp. PhB165 TaxID=2485105 RepID=UPI00104FF322|nr:hypothetical protein [Novosphingobium sp. PhB165]TCM20857.1 thymidylate kinase [Novosphingobium sp. PhB165]
MTIQKSPREIASCTPLDSSFAQRPALSLVTADDSALAPCIALVGCDGSGKSTLARDLVALLEQQAPTRAMYLGLGTGDLGRKIGQVPLIGRIVERFLTSKAKRAHEGDARAAERKASDKRLPGLVTALAMFAFSLARQRRFRKVLDYRRQGVQVVTDRYPQAEIPGSFDGPGLSWMRKGSALVERLASRERALYDGMAAYRPTVVIRLNVDVDTAMGRKADHERAMLEKKLAVMPTLRFGGAQIVDVDATRPYREVLDTVRGVLRRHGLQT